MPKRSSSVLTLAEPTPSADRYSIRVLDRAMGLLKLLSDGRPRLLMDIASELKLNSSTTFRLLNSLQGHRLVERNPETNKYGLGLACLELARAFSMSYDLKRLALPTLQTLRDETRETVHMGVLDGTEVVYLEKLHGLQAVAVGLMGSQVGGRAPAYCTAMGKVMLANLAAAEVSRRFKGKAFKLFNPRTTPNLETLLKDLEPIRSLGYALDKGEFEAEVRCVAASIKDASGQVVAALSISGPASRMEPLESKQDLIEKALMAAREITGRLQAHSR